MSGKGTAQATTRMQNSIWKDDIITALRATIPVEGLRHRLFKENELHIEPDQHSEQAEVVFALEDALITRIVVEMLDLPKIGRSSSELEKSLNTYIKDAFKYDGNKVNAGVYLDVEAYAEDIRDAVWAAINEWHEKKANAISRVKKADGTGIDTLVDHAGRHDVKQITLNHAGGVYAVNGEKSSVAIPLEEYLKSADVSEPMAAAAIAYREELAKERKSWAAREGSSTGTKKSRG